MPNFTWFLLGDADDSTSRSSSSIASGFAKLVTALAEVVNVSVDHHSATNDGVLASERDHAVSDVSSHVTEIPHVPLARAVFRSSVLAFVRIEAYLITYCEEH